MNTVEIPSRLFLDPTLLPDTMLEWMGSNAEYPYRFEPRDDHCRLIGDCTDLMMFRLKFGF